MDYLRGMAPGADKLNAFLNWSESDAPAPSKEGDGEESAIGKAGEQQEVEEEDILQEQVQETDVKEPERKSLGKRLSKRLFRGTSRSTTSSNGSRHSKDEVEVENEANEPELIKSSSQASNPSIGEKRKDTIDEGEGESLPKPPSVSTRIQGLISKFKSGGLTDYDDSKKPVRESLLRLQKRTSTSKKLRNKPTNLHEKCMPSDELKWVLEKTDDQEEEEEEEAKPKQLHEDIVVEEQKHHQEGEEEAEVNSQQEEDDEEQEAKRKSRISMAVNRIRSMNASPDCTLCGKKVYRMEKLSDSRDRPFHYYCLKCKECPKSQVGQQVYICPSEEDPSKNELYCKVHWHFKTHGNNGMVKGWAPETNVNFGGAYDDDAAGARKAVRKSLGMSMGRKPLCTRCGGEILLSEKNFVVSGLERFHETCPTTDAIKHTPRHFVLGAPNRVPILFATDSKAKRAYSFLFVMEETSSKEEALAQHRLAPARLEYAPDQSAYASTTRQIPTKNQEFLVYDSKKTYKEIQHPLTGEQGYTRYDELHGLVFARLFKVEGGVVHGLHVAFRYNYNEKSHEAEVEALALELTFETLDEDGYAGDMTTTAKNMKSDAPPKLTIENTFEERIISSI